MSKSKGRGPSVVEEVTDRIAFEIASHSIAPGQRLASVRELAQIHKINPSTRIFMRQADQPVLLALYDTIGEILLTVPAVLAAMYSKPAFNVGLWKTLVERLGSQPSRHRSRHHEDRPRPSPPFTPRAWLTSRSASTKAD